MKKLILPFILLSMASGLSSAFMLWNSNYQLIWAGSFLATFPLPFLLMILSGVLGLARTSSRLPLVQLSGILGVILLVYSVATSNVPLHTSDYVAAGLTIYGVAFVQWYVWIYSSYGRQSSQQLVKGQTLPESALKDLEGNSLTTASFSGAKTLIVFFRANWCPFCMNQLKEVLKLQDELKRLGVAVKFISNQGVSHSQKLAKKLALPPHFAILQDDDLLTAKALGIADIGGSPAGLAGYPEDTVMATVIALNEAGEVIFGDETDNYRVRPHPDTFMDVFG